MFKKMYVTTQTFFLFFAIFSLNFSAQAADMGVPVQLRLRAPDATYPTGTLSTVTLKILSPSGCMLREEQFTNVPVTDGFVSIALGVGVATVDDPGLTLNSVYNNAVAKTNLKCYDANNNEISSGQTYTPAATDGRLLRIVTTVNADPILVDFHMKSAPYAIQAESVGGKAGSDILVQAAGTQLTQANLQTLLADATKYNNLLNLAANGQATNATNFSGNLAGDVTGTQAATVVTKIRGTNISATAPTSGQVLTYDGSQYTPVTPAAAAVSSVNGKTGAVILTVTDISGAVTSTTAFSGDVTGNINATVVSSVGGKSAATIAATVNDVSSATALGSLNTLVRRDSSGNITANTVSALNSSVQFVNIYEGTNTNYVRLKAPTTFSNYTLTLPTTSGTNGQYLSVDGAGSLVWTTPGISSSTLTTSTSFSGDVSGNYNSLVLANSGVAAGTYAKVTVDAKGRVTSGHALLSSDVTTALGYTPASNTALANYVAIANNLSDLASSSTARANLGLGGAAELNVGTTAGTVAAGDDVRITGALSQSAFNGYVASANCTAGQSMYWNSVSSTFLCQNIIVSGDISGIASNATVTKLQGTGVSFSAIANGHILQYDGTNIVNRAIPTCAAGEYLTFNGSVWSCATDSGGGSAITSVNVTAPISSTGGSAPTLSIAQANGSTNGYLSSADWTTFNSKVTSAAASVAQMLGYIPASATSLTGFMVKSNNLSDLVSSATARTNLGLGGAAVLNVGTTAGTVAAGDDLRIANALSTSTNFSGDVSGTYNSLVLANSGVAAGTYAKVTVDAKGRVTSGNALFASDITTALGYTPASSTALGSYVTKANNLSDLASSSTARTNLGLGGAAVLNVGTTAGTVAAGDDSRIANALSTSTNFSGDISGAYNSIVLANSGVNAGTYATVTVDAKGRVTSGNALTSSNVTTALGFTPISNSLSSARFYVGNGLNVASAVTMSGDATLANTGALTLKNTGTAGTYGAADKSLSLTTDAQGRVTSVTENSISIVSSQVTDFATTVLGTVLTGFSAATATAVTAADTVLSAIGKLQGQLNTILSPATTMVSANTAITTTSTSNVLMTGMTITPPAGTYQVEAVTTMSHASSNATISFAIYAGGSQVAASVTTSKPYITGVMTVNMSIPQMAIAEVTVNGAQAIEARWWTSTGTATSTNRTMIIRRVR